MKNNHNNRYRLLVILIIYLFHTISLIGNAEENNLLFNGDFEDNTLKGWEKDIWNKGGSIDLTNQNVYDGSYSLKISSGDIENDIRVTQEIEIDPSSYYSLSAWIATENVQKDKVGANICIMSGFDYEGNVTGTQDWKRYELKFQTSKSHYYVKIAARLGMYYNTVKGTAYFDNIKLEKLDSTPKDFIILKELEGANPEQNNKKGEEINKVEKKESVFGKLNVPLIILLISIGLGITGLNIYLVIRREKKDAHDE